MVKKSSQKVNDSGVQGYLVCDHYSVLKSEIEENLNLRGINLNIHTHKY